VKIHVEVEGEEKQRKAALPYAHANHVRVDGQCPSCKAGEEGSFRCMGKASAQTVGHDTNTAPALALCCGSEVGKIVVTMSTIFGIEEDRAVLNERSRVY
jgi:hypothetical protein